MISGQSIQVYTYLYNYICTYTHIYIDVYIYIDIHACCSFTHYNIPRKPYFCIASPRSQSSKHQSLKALGLLGFAGLGFGVQNFGVWGERFRVGDQDLLVGFIWFPEGYRAITQPQVSFPPSALLPNGNRKDLSSKTQQRPQQPYRPNHKNSKL